MDGPMAYALYMRTLEPSERPKCDEDHFDAAEAIQVAHRLPTNCTGRDYQLKAVAFTTKIMDNATRPYTEEQAADLLRELESGKARKIRRDDLQAPARALG